MKNQPALSYRRQLPLETLESRRLMSLTTTLVPVAISQAALDADPSLANYKTYDVQVNLDAGEKFIAMDLHATLTSGTFYNVDDAHGGSTVPIPQLWSRFPNAEFDTFVCKSGFSKPIILGQADPPTANGGIFSDTVVNVAFGSAPPDTGTGTFTVGRLTVSKDANGTVVGDDSSTNTNNQLKPFQFNLVNGGVVVLSSISGNVFNDTNGSGTDDGDAGISGWKVYLDKNQNGSFDSGEKFRLTDVNGDYSFDSLTPGTYYVRQVTPTGYRRTAPSKTSYTVGLSSGVNGTGKNFGDTTTALLSGTVFNDKNSDGKKQSSEGGVSGFMIYLDANNNGTLDSGEKVAGSDSNGYWVFKSVKSGTYQVRIQSRSGYHTVGTTNFSLKMASGGTYTGRLFAEHKLA